MTRAIAGCLYEDSRVLCISRFVIESGAWENGKISIGQIH